NAVAGVATFPPDLAVDKAGGGYTLVATSGALTPDLGTPFTVTGTTAQSLVWGVQPLPAAEGSSILGAASASLTVTIVDAGLTVVPGATNAVTIDLGNNPGNGILGGTRTVNAINGTATFSNLTLDQAAGGYTFTASAGALTPVTSLPFAVNAATARQLAFGNNPTTTVLGAVINVPGPGVTVRIENALTGLVTTATNPITLQIGANPGSGVLGGTVTVNAINGVATFPNLTIDQAATGYTLTASSQGLTGAVSAPAFNITGTTAVALVWGTQPTALPGTTAEGAVISGPAGVTVTIVDSLNAVVPAATNAITIQFGANPANGTLGGTLTQNAVLGVATFDDLRIDQAGALYSLSASSGALTPAQSNTFTVSASTARNLVFVAPLVPTTEGAVINTPGGVTVRIEDSGNNVVTGATNPVTIQLGSNPGSGTLGGTLTRTPVLGVVTFDDLTIDQAAGLNTYSLTVGSPGLTGATSGGFTVGPGAARQLGFLAPPLATTEGAVINTPGGVTVQIQDSNGAVVLGSTNLVTIQLGSNPGSGILGGTLSANAVNGVATFATLTIDEANALPYTLTATSGGLTSTNSANFLVNAATADNLFFSAPPTTENSFTDINSPGGIVVFVRDSANGLVAAASQQRLVTLLIGTNPNTGVLIGTKSVMSVGGLATFTDIQINNPGVGYRLTAVATGLTAANSGAFTINGAAPSTGDRLTITGAPTDADQNAVVSIVANTPAAGALTVQIEDAGGTLVAGATDLVTVSFGANPAGGTLSGTLTVPAAGGIATFSDLTVDNAGTAYTLTFSSGALTGVTSGVFNIDQVTATNLAFTVQPVVNTGQNAQVLGPAAASVTVRLEDDSNTLVTTSGVPITLSLGTNPAVPAGTLGGGLTVLTVGGIATFPSLSINNSAVGYTFVATAGSLTPIASNPFNITITQGASLSFAPGNGGVQPATPVAQNGLLGPTVRLLDAAGNPLVAPAGSGVRVTLSFGVNPAGGTLTGDLSVVTLAGGVAAFPNVSVNNVGAAYTLVASAAGITPGESAGFTVTASTPSRLNMFVEPAALPATTTAGQVINNPGPFPSVEILTSAGLRDTTATNPVTIQFGNNPSSATLTGTLTVNAINGLATFNNLAIDRGGSAFRLTASAQGLTGTISGPFDVVGGVQTASLVIGSGPLPSANPTENENFSFTVQALDAGLAGVPNVPITIQLASNPGGATLTGVLTATTNAGGTASFGPLSLDKTNGALPGYRILATSSGVPDILSAPFNITPLLADSLAITVPAPGLVVEGTAFGLTVQVRDSQGANLTQVGIPVTLALANSPNGGVLSGTLTVPTIGNGTAVFANVVLTDAVGPNHRLIATSPGTTSALTVAPGFTVTASQAQALSLTGGVPAITEGVPFSLVVQLRDSVGGPVGTSNVPVTLQLSGIPLTGGELNGTTTVLTVGGVATFSNNLLITGNSTFPFPATPEFQIMATAPGVNTLQIGPFNVTATTARSVSVTTQPPATTPVNNTFGFTATVLNGAGNPVLTSGTPVTVALANNPGGAILSGVMTVPTLGGVATFAGLALDKPGVDYQLVVTSPGLTSGLTAAVPPVGVAGAGFDISGAAAGVATSLTFVGVIPNQVENTAFAAITLQALDQFSNPVPAGFPVTLQLATNPGGAVLSGATTVLTGAGGFAIFPTGPSQPLRLNQAGVGYQLLATGAGVPDVLSNTFDVTGNAADHLVIVTAGFPVSVNQNTTFTVAVRVENISGNLLGNGIPVSLALASNPGGSILSGPTTVLTVGGIATFNNNLVLDKPGTAYQLLAISEGLPTVLTPAFNVNAVGNNTPAALVITQGPPAPNAVEGVNFPFVVRVDNAVGNPVPDGTNVTLSLASNPGGALLIGDLTVPTIGGAGLATFTLQVDRASPAATNYQILVSSSGVPDVLSATFTAAPNTARALSFALGGGVQPGPAGPYLETDTFSVTVQLVDSANGNTPLVGVPVTIDLATNPGSATLAGTLTRNTIAGGIAVFPGLSLNQSGTYTIRATSSGLTTAISGTFVVNPALPRQLAFTANPTLTASGNIINVPGGVVVRVENSIPGAVLNQPILVTLVLASNPNQGVLFGTTSVMSDNNGLATFTTLQINRAGVGYRLTALASGLTSAQSTLFDVSGAAANIGDHLTIFPLEPVDANENAVIQTAALAPITVEVRDTVNALVPTASGTVTVSLANNPANGILSGTLTVPAAFGIATFNDLRIDKANVPAAASAYQLVFTSNGLTEAVSAGFDILPITADNLNFEAPILGSTGQNQQIFRVPGGLPLTPVRVQLRNALNAPVGTTGIPITLSLAVNPANPAGTLSGTTTVQTTIGGVAIFDNLSIDQVGTGYQFIATAGSLTPQLSSLFNITPNEARRLSFTNAGGGAGVQPPLTTDENAALAPAVVVQLLDSAGNAINLGNVRVNLSLADNPAGGTLNGITSVLTAGGVATFTGISIDKAGAAYRLLATAYPGGATPPSTSAITPATSIQFTILPATPFASRFLVQPVTQTSGAFILANSPFAPNPFLLTGANAIPAATLPILPGTVQIVVPTALGARTIRDVFNPLLPNIGTLLPEPDALPGGGTINYTTGAITGTTGLLAGAGVITETHGFTGTALATEDIAIAPSIQIEIVDAGGGRVGSFGGPVTLNIGANPGAATLAGTLTAFAVNGVATFNNVIVSEGSLGQYSLVASVDGLNDTASAPFTIGFNQATRLVFGSHPTAQTPPAAPIALGNANGGGTFNLNTTPITVTGGNPILPGSIVISVTDAGSTAQTVTDYDPDPSTPATGVLIGTGGVLPVGTINYTTGVMSGVFTTTLFGGSAVTVTAYETEFISRTTTPLNTVGPGIYNLNAANILATRIRPNTLVLSGPALNGETITDNGSGGLTGTGGILPAGGTINYTSGAMTGLTAPLLAGDINEAHDQGGGTIGVAFSGIRVLALDGVGNLDTNFTGLVTLAISNNPVPGTGTLGGLLVQQAVNGVATFGPLTIDIPNANYSLAATSPGLTNVVSGNFDIGGTVTSRVLVMVQQPTNAGEHVAIAPAMTVQVEDTGGIPVLQAGIPVTVAIDTNPSNGTLTGTFTALTGPTGLASFAGISIDNVGTNYQLRFSANGLTGVTTSQFDITANTFFWAGQPDPVAAPGGTAKNTALQTGLAIPNNDLVVQIRNGVTPVNGLNVPVTVSIASNPASGILAGTRTVTSINGVATFANLLINKPGTGYTLIASSSAVTPSGSDVSGAFNIIGGAGGELVWTAQPAASTAENVVI
ncbi:MAG: hypothetical protein JKY65_16985, partial [Planctomycetes bacterium]|nr:hypothetical protein [Planctomycetota bacterium]